MNPRSFFPAGVLLSLGLSACDGSLTASDAPSIANPLDAERSAAVAEVDAVRAAHSPPAAALTVCASLNVSASAHSDDLRDNSATLMLGSPGSNGSTPRQRACSAGYEPACTDTPAMGEVVADGNATGTATADQWATDPVAGPLLVNPAFIVVGVGRSEGADGWYWTMDLASMNDPSCAM
jgi:uncharacterized protein YkwD